MLQIYQTKSETGLGKNKKLDNVFYILVYIFIVIIMMIFAIKLNRSELITDKRRIKVEVKPVNSMECRKVFGVDLLCYSKQIQQKLAFFTQESRQKQPLFSSETNVIATNILQAKKAIDQSFLTIKRVVLLLKHRFLILRDLLEKNQALAEREAKISQNKDALTFIKGLVLGQKDKNNDYYAVFQLAGMVHVLVASGFNVSLLAGLINDILFFVSRKMKLICSLLTIWFYIWFLKAEAPLLRAGVMASFYLIIKYFGSRISSRRIVFYSGAILLIFFTGFTQKFIFLVFFFGYSWFIAV